MPAKSAKQYRFMAMVANTPSKDKKARGVGPSKEVAQKFVDETPRKKRSMFMKKGRDSKGRGPTGR